MDRLGEAVSKELLLSIRRAVPLRSDTFRIVTVTFAETLRLISMFPCATTFTNATLVQDELIMSFASGSVELIT